MVEVVLRNPKMAIAMLAQSESLEARECPETSPQTSQARRYMQDEEDHLLHELPIRTVITWTRWWCITSKAVVLVFKKKSWGVIGAFLWKKRHYSAKTCVLHSWERSGLEEGRIFTLSRPEDKPRVPATFRAHYSMTKQNIEHPTQGMRRRHKSPSNVSAALLLPVPRLADHLDTYDGPSDEEGGKKRNDRSQSRLLLSLLPADPQMSTMRLWESLKWILGKLKGLRRGLNRNSKMLKKKYQRI